MTNVRAVLVDCHRWPSSHGNTNQLFPTAKMWRTLRFFSLCDWNGNETTRFDNNSIVWGEADPFSTAFPPSPIIRRASIPYWCETLYTFRSLHHSEYIGKLLRIEFRPRNPNVPEWTTIILDTLDTVINPPLFIWCSVNSIPLWNIMVWKQRKKRQDQPFTNWSMKMNGKVLQCASRSSPLNHLW